MNHVEVAVALKRRARRRLFLPALLLLILCVAWSAFWFYAAGNVRAAIAGWMQAEAQGGRLWTCADQGVTGFPFRIEYRCRQPTFEGVLAGRQVTGSAGDLTALAHVYQPNLVLADLGAPFAMREATGLFSATARWTQLRVSYRHGRSGPERVSLEWEKPNLQVTQAGSAAFVAEADDIQTHARRNPSSDNSLDFALSASGARIPLVDAATGEDAPIDVALETTLEAIDAVVGPTRAEALDNWRASGGALRVTSATINKGPAAIGAQGRFALDEAHRPQGTLNLQASGVEPLLRRFGVPTAALAIGSLLGGFGAAPDAAANGLPAAMRLALTFNGGRVSLGPVRLPFALLPLY